MSTRLSFYKPRAPRIRRRTAPGTAPGTLHIPTEVTPPKLRVAHYSAGHLNECELNHVGEVRDCMVQQDGGLLAEGTVTWVHVEGPGDLETLETLSKIFKLHALALEDVVTDHQRAKVEEYDDHLYIVLRVLSPPPAMENEQLSLFLGSRFVLTFQQLGTDVFEPVRQRLRQARGRLRVCGADYLAYALIDAIVDSYFPVVDEYGESIEELDRQIGERSALGFIESLQAVRANLMALRRVVRPLRDALGLVMSDPHQLISKDTHFYLRDCYDHTIQLMDLLDSYREMSLDLRDFYMSVMSSRMNEVMRVLTVIATVFIPLSFIAGLYGMNFNTDQPGNMPELNWPYGYVFALLLMGLVGVGLLGFIWYKGWLKSDGRARRL
jgi:magnesium transporter